MLHSTFLFTSVFSCLSFPTFHGQTRFFSLSHGPWWTLSIPHPILACHLLLSNILCPAPSILSYLCILSPIKAFQAPHIASNLRLGLGMRSQLKYWVKLCARRGIKWENPPILFSPLSALISVLLLAATPAHLCSFCLYAWGQLNFKNFLGETGHRWL